jgi:hypothetical protein
VRTSSPKSTPTWSGIAPNGRLRPPRPRSATRISTYPSCPQRYTVSVSRSGSMIQ